MSHKGENGVTIPVSSCTHLNPGSDEAIRMGCLCPRIDNHYGRGWGGNGRKYGWIRVLSCPLHGDPEELGKKGGG